MLISKLLNPKTDYVFKRIFGYKGNEDVTASFLSAILEHKVTELELDTNPILDKDYPEDKIGILDIKAKLDNTINCDIEIQVINQKEIQKRILFYWSKLYINSIKKGQNYSNLEKAIVILIADFEVEGLEGIKKYISKWNIREKDYPKTILTNVLDLYIIELPKFKKYMQKNKNKLLDSWIKFIENPEDIDMSIEMSEEDKKDLEKAREILEDISASERERYLAEQREIQIMDKYSIEEYGYDKGIIKGRKEGKREGIIQVAKKLKQEKTSIELIMKATGLTKEEIEKL